jgi:hypothetical protein
MPAPASPDLTSTEPDPPPIHFPSLVWIFLAALAGVAVGAIFFGNHAPPAGATARPPANRLEPKPSPPEPQPRLVLETQIVRKNPLELRVSGAHRFAVFNGGDSVLKIEPGAFGQFMSVREYPKELAPRKMGYVTVAWFPFRDYVRSPCCSWVLIHTNDPENTSFVLVIAEDDDETKGTGH